MAKKTLKPKYPKFTFPKTPEREANYHALERLMGEATLSKTFDILTESMLRLRENAKKFRFEDLELFLPADKVANFYKREEVKR